MLEENAQHAATVLVLHSGSLSTAAQDALQASATALGHVFPAVFADVQGLSPRSLSFLVHERDPWSVVAVDDASIDALRAAFDIGEENFAPDAPTIECGYTLVAVPGFANCLQDQTAKRIAWERLKAAKHPGSPY